MRHSLTLILALILALFAIPASGASIAKISYLTSSTVYIDAGNAQGLAEGDSVEVWRGGQRLGSLVVDYTSQTRSTCPLKGVSFQPRVGDEIHFVPGEVHDLAAPVVVEEASTEVKNEALWKGRVGASFLGVRTREDFGQNFDQPAGDLRLSGRHLAQDHLDLEIDARARHTYRRPTEGAKSDQALNRVYRASLSWSPPASSSGLVLGRQSSPELANLSIFDGASATLRHERWSGGLVGGVQPTLGDLEFSTEVMELGAFYRRQAAKNQQEQRWNLTLATIASYRKSEINREYLYLQGSWADPRWSLFASQELDLNRGWKRNFNSSVITPTASYLFARYRVRRELRLKAGFDNRRRVRLWPDRETPETLFDETYRRGYWVGADSRLGRSWNLGLDFRGSSGGSAGSASVISLRASWFDLRQLPLEIGGRFSRFGNDRYDGILASLNLGWELSSTLRLDGEGGIRSENHGGFVMDQNDQHWLGLRAEAALQAGWFLNFSGEWTRGGIDATDLYYSSLNYRF